MQGWKGNTDYTRDLGNDASAWYDGYKAIHEVVEVQVDSMMPTVRTSAMKVE
jgi:hypothetical protein